MFIKCLDMPCLLLKTYKITSSEKKEKQLLVVKYGLEVLRAWHMGSMIQNYEKAKGESEEGGRRWRP